MAVHASARLLAASPIALTLTIHYYCLQSAQFLVELFSAFQVVTSFGFFPLKVYMRCLSSEFLQLWVI